MPKMFLRDRVVRLPRPAKTRDGEMIFYHITTYEALPFVMPEGLRPSKTVKGETILFPIRAWTDKIIRLQFWRKRKTQGYVLLRVEVPKGWVHGTWFTKRIIPTERIQIVKDLGRVD